MITRKNRQCKHNVTLRSFLATIVYVEKQYVLHIVIVFVVLGRTTLSFVACYALLFFPTLSLKWHYFRNKVLNIKCVIRFLCNGYLKYFSFPEELGEI